MKRIVTVFCALIMACVSFLPAYAADVNVTVDGEELTDARLIDSVTYVPLRKFSQSVSSSTVAWNDSNKTASVFGDGVVLYAGIGKEYIEGNGRFLFTGNENLLIDGTTYVPVRVAAKVMGAEVLWDSISRTATVTTGGEPIEHGEEFYDSGDLYWLSRVINAESRGESLIGKIAVGNVVLNRVESNNFPNNIYDVIFDMNGGVQFTPVANGSIYNSPTEESVIAAKICLEKYKITDKNVLFFFNPSISVSTWIPENRDYVMTIGQHKFYA